MKIQDPFLKDWESLRFDLHIFRNKVLLQIGSFEQKQSDKFAHFFLIQLEILISFRVQELFIRENLRL